MSASDEEEVADAIRLAFSRMDKSILTALQAAGGEPDGCTALAALHLGRKLFVANAGGWSWCAPVHAPVCTAWV